MIPEPREQNTRPIESLDSKHMMAVILYIHETGPCRKTDIYNNVGRGTKMADKLESLRKSRIIVETTTYRGSIFDLTESGHHIAEHLQDIEMLLV